MTRIRKWLPKLALVATSVMVLEAMRAAQYVSDKAGIEVEIIDLNSISHPDWDLVANSVRKTGKLVIADTRIVPQMAALDPLLMAGLPPAVTAG